jgi:hypothetical protein
VVEPEPEPEPEPEVEPEPEPTGRRISGFLELRDGGFGVGSAAPIEDGAQPLDHPVQAYRDTMTFREPGVPGYDSAEPDVWFYDAVRCRAVRIPPRGRLTSARRLTARLLAPPARGHPIGSVQIP